MGELYTLISGKDKIEWIVLCALFIAHRTVIHSKNFINPWDETRTQAIESLWNKFKKQIKNTKGIAGDKLELLLSELMYKNNQYVFSGFEAVIVLLGKN